MQLIQNNSNNIHTVNAAKIIIESKRIESIYTYFSKKMGIKMNEKKCTLVPWVRVIRVFPTFLVLKTEGALMSYHSFFAKGSTLQD